MNIIDDDIYGILRDHWGYDSFRPAQEEIIRSVLSGRDTIGLLPTGGGKSITFQIPALAIDGLTIVVSPLISLMKDQVDNLREKGIAATYLHSALTQRETRLAIDRCRLGKAKILYLSPEKLGSRSFIDILRRLPVALIVVDEAHCISQWGYDFRPSYLNIATARTLFPGAPVLALTASATPDVVDDISRQLKMNRPAIHRLSFSRPNLSYIVRYADYKEGKLIEILQRVAGCAIVYVRSRRRTREIAQALVREGISADFYHAGLMPQEKEERQNDWKENRTRVIVATNAFGMGIDKPDVRIVVHMDLPSSLEEYYQEAGRAGRDGKPALAVTIAARSDKAMLGRRLSEAYPDKDYIRRIYRLACVFLDIAMGEGYNTINEFNLPLFCLRNALQPVAATSALHLLSQSGYLDFSEEITTRSRLMMLVTREELYALDLPHDAEVTLRQVLRSYTGLFADYVYISESVIAAATSMTERQVYESLLLLTRMHVIHYVPRKTSPYIFLPTSREDERHITIPKAVYETRRELMKGRIDAMRRFIFDTTACRVNTLLTYFGEDAPENCGHCDVCRSKQAKESPKDFSQQILYVLRDHQPRSPVEISHILNISIETTAQQLRPLIDSGQLLLNPDSTVNLA